MAVALALHWPNVRPTNQRLRTLTGHSNETPLLAGWHELKAKGLRNLEAFASPG